jgi:hypothetical protein
VIALVYSHTLHILKNSLVRVIQESVSDIFFWEDMLFYVTRGHVRLVVIHNEVLELTIASLEVPTSILNLCSFLNDPEYLYPLQPEVQLKPPG